VGRQRVAALCALLVAFVVLGFAAPTAGSAATGATGTCVPNCNPRPASGSHASARTRSTSSACLRDAGCGGGFALGGGWTNLALGVIAAGTVLALGLIAVRRRFVAALQPVGRLMASGLFRPPQFSSSI
jgi:hypothetical protein